MTTEPDSLAAPGFVAFGPDDAALVIAGVVYFWANAVAGWASAGERYIEENDRAAAIRGREIARTFDRLQGAVLELGSAIAQLERLKR